MRPKTIVILAYDGAQPIDIAGPLQAFATANEEAGGEAYRVKVAALRGGALDLAGGLRGLGAPPPSRADTLLVPGGPRLDAAEGAPARHRGGRKVRATRARVRSVCSGGFPGGGGGLVGHPPSRHALAVLRPPRYRIPEYPSPQ